MMDSMKRIRTDRLSRSCILVAYSSSLYLYFNSRSYILASSKSLQPIVKKEHIFPYGNGLRFSNCADK